MEKHKQAQTEQPFIPMTSLTSGLCQKVTNEVYCLNVQIVNVCFVGNPVKEKGWVLVDAGMPKSTEMIIDALKNEFGTVQPPSAIILTHGHFDHVGAVKELADKWNVPIYAHELEIPYLTNRKSYPEPDPSVEGGLIAKMSSLFPNEPIQLGERVKALPDNHEIPGMKGWRWIHTPGHTPGHVSFYREKDHVLIAGDAFVTVKQESLYKVLTQEQEISGPPRYLTTDWKAAWDSVKTLQELSPSLAITGHGLPMYGQELTNNLENLANKFDQIAIPDYGRYVNQ
ncbi:MBL fold metallo-hydrolase [Halalkalibacter urbisdiaboli]|uniref:MBL fold metallo-hydrolase n=1 Tax=Halalkalibacter urbisdiaboli TaxID=1960589 RepID=UPI003CC9FDE5